MRAVTLKYLLFFSLFFTPTSFAAGGAAFAPNLDQALRAAGKHQQFSVPFSQETYSALRDKVSLSEGVLSIQKPSSFRFELTTPRATLYVSDGRDFWKYDPSLKHAQHLDAQAADFEFVKLLTDLSNLKKQYTVSQWSSAGQKSDLPAVQSDLPPAPKAGQIAIKLEPQKDKQQKVLYAIMDVKSGFMEELRMVHLNGNRMRMMFGKPSTKLLDREQFHFTPPEGVAVDK